MVYGNSKSISYIPSSTTNGYIELNFSLPIPMIQRYNNNKEPGSVYGDTGKFLYIYDSHFPLFFPLFPSSFFFFFFFFFSICQRIHNIHSITEDPPLHPLPFLFLSRRKMRKNPSIQTKTYTAKNQKKTN